MNNKRCKKPKCVQSLGAFTNIGELQLVTQEANSEFAVYKHVICLFVVSDLW